MSHAKTKNKEKVYSGGYSCKTISTHRQVPVPLKREEIVGRSEASTIMMQGTVLYSRALAKSVLADYSCISRRQSADDIFFDCL